MKPNVSNVIAAVVASAVALTGFGLLHAYENAKSKKDDVLKIGFIFDGDASTAYTANFMLAVDQLSSVYGDRIEVVEKYHVPYDAVDVAITDLVDSECDMIVTNSYGYGAATKKKAETYPQIQFCSATCDNANTEPLLQNYHTFMGEIYQGRYVCGVMAGKKLASMIASGEIMPEEAVIGYVAAYPVAEVISGYTAFLLGVRSQCPSAVMRVRYTNTWTSYAIEKSTAETLIQEGCRLIAQHSDTIGPALACENADLPYQVFHVGYNRDMTEVAPTVSLISTRIDWFPYLSSAVSALLDQDSIESTVAGSVFGNDVAGGFAEGWVSMFQLNSAVMPEGSELLLDTTINTLKTNNVEVFSGNYIGINPEDENDTYDLNTPYQENSVSSAPTFRYVIRDIITVEE